MLKMKKMFLLIILLCQTFFFCVSDSDLIEENENRILKFRADLDQIGVDFENFLYDLVMEVMKTYGKATDPISRFKLPKTANPAQDLLDKYIEQIKQFNSVPPVSTTTISPIKLQNNYLENIVAKHPSLVTNNRLKKRDVDPSEFVGDSSSNCGSKNQHERNLEMLRLDELKQEVEKLKSLVYLLKNQQKTISALDGIVTDNISPRNEGQITNFINRNSSDFPNQVGHNSVHEELASLKNDLHETILLLNATRAFLEEEEHEGISLRNEIKKLNIELGEMRLMIQKMYQSNNISIVSTPEELLGVSPHLPKNLPVETMQKSRQNMEDSKTNVVDSRARSSDLDKLLKKLDTKNEIPTELDKLQEILKRKRERETMRALIQKLLKNTEKPSERDLLNDESDNLNELRKLLKALDQPENRIDDDIVNDDLKELEKAINALQPHETNKNDLRDLDNGKLMKLLLVDLLQRHDLEGKQDGVGPKGPSLTPQQIADLRKRLDKIAAGNKQNSVQHFPTMDHYENVPYQPPYFPPSNPYGMFVPPYPYQFNYATNMRPTPNEFTNEQFGNIAPNNPYVPITNIQDVPTVPLNYAEVPAINQFPSYPSGPNNQFFPNPRPYDKLDPNNIPPTENVSGGSPVQSGAYQQAGPYMEDYKTKTVQQLKSDIGSLHQYIGGLKSNPNYNDGQAMIPRLENQLNELQDIIYGLDHEASAQQLSNPKAPSLEQNYNNDRRTKRSLEEELGPKLYNEVMTKLQAQLRPTTPGPSPSVFNFLSPSTTTSHPHVIIDGIRDSTFPQFDDYTESTPVRTDLVTERSSRYPFNCCIMDNLETPDFSDPNIDSFCCKLTSFLNTQFQ